ncbi:2-hydroxymuconate tautomerase family protein [Fictibacillus nanhaiensis]|uniref:2-hydroxymuconate tautomerase family protein n=1 Tax=Fictibacillus nanhaiensis TaxID=742169 RepID=UPI002E221C78|nr:2-hydroxymuconate tautomerase family protein [Fictibacillus nanhaiensis]MED1864904.1 2-hydroxymuconate tautomerase family protein [Fictibacillus nanhaiensis]
MPIIQVHVIEGRTDEQLSNLMERLTVAAAESLNVKKEQVRVLIQEVPNKYWGVGGRPKI